MHITQHDRGCLFQVSYMITDERTKTAAVVDPQRDVDSIISKLVPLSDTTLV